MGCAVIASPSPSLFVISIRTHDKLNWNLGPELGFNPLNLETIPRFLKVDFGM